MAPRQNTSPAAAILLVIITILVPPVGVFCVSGCSCDLLINLCLTLLGYLPGHIHAFYVEYQYYKRREEQILSEPIDGIYRDSDGARGYGTV